MTGGMSSPINPVAGGFFRDESCAVSFPHWTAVCGKGHCRPKRCFLGTGSAGVFTFFKGRCWGTPVRGEQCSRGRQVFGGVNGNGVVVGFDGLEGFAVLNEAQLFKGFDLFDPRWGQGGVGFHGGARVGVNTDVGPVGRAGIREPVFHGEAAPVGNGAA